MRILLTHGRSAITLDLARQLHRAGHSVFVADTVRHTVCHLSAAVRRFFVVPSPRDDTELFVQAIRRIVEQAHVERIVPVFEEVLYLAQDPSLQPLLFAAPFDVLDRLHNKYSFAQTAQSLGVPTAQTALITRVRDLAQLDRSYSYALKPCYARAAQALVHLTPEMPLPAIRPTPAMPYVAQRWIEGRRYCSYSVCQGGEVRAHVVYPVRYTIDGHSCVYFQMVEHTKIDAWVTQFAAGLKLDGQIAIDFIETDAGQLVAIECNPRATSGVHLLGHTTQLAEALGGTPALGASPVGISPPKQVAFGMLLYAWRKRGRHNLGLGAWVKALLRTRDVVFDWRDVWPWLMQPLALWTLWRRSRALGLSLPNAFLYDFEWDATQQTPPEHKPACTEQRRYA